MRKKRRADQQLLKQMRDDFAYYKQAWKEHHYEGRLDMRYVAGDPWDEEDKKARKEAGRPCISPDEINQYLNQACNNLRQNKRSIKMLPAGQTATDKDAEFAENHIRAIEYRSSAQRNAYIPAAECAMQRGYGFFRISRDYVSDDSFDQEIVIKGILNPDSVLYDPDCRTADWSDAMGCFVFEPMRKDEFKREHPNAEVTSFGSDDMREAPDWIRDDHIVRAEWWRVTKEVRTLLLIDVNGVPTKVFEDEVQAGTEPTILKSRDVVARKVRQYLTNGIEILEETDQPGPYIPIIPVIGRELWVDEGSGAKRKIFSMVRLARDPQMYYAYLCSNEAEEAKMTPKAPAMGYTGQFETDKEAWDNLTDIPRPYVQIDPVVEAATGQVLPLPTRPQFQPNFQAYELAKDAARRMIMSAMGITPLPTAAQRNNEKSGVALDKIRDQESVGAFHFVDNFDRALELAGRIIQKWRPIVYDTERDLPLHTPDGKRKVVRANTQEPYQDEQGTTHHYPVDKGELEPTITTGPSYASEREEAAEFSDRLIASAPDLMGRIGDLVVKMRNLGPLGDEIAERLTPPEFAKAGSPEQAVAMIGQAKQQMAAMQQQFLLIKAEHDKLLQEKQGKVVDNEYRLKLAQMEIEAKIAVAEVTTKAQVLNERVKFVEDLYAQFHGQAHDAAMAMQAHQNQLQQGEAAAAQQAAQQPAAVAQEPQPAA